MKKKNEKVLVPQCLSNLVPSKRAFTLAEVLITLGIIGVVAAMTIPTLVTNYKEKVMVTKVKQSYALLSQAFQLAIVGNGPISTWDLGTGMEDANSHSNFANYLKPNLKLLEDCIGKDVDYVSKHCTSDSFYRQSRNAANVVLPNGLLVGVRIWNPKGSTYWTGGESKTYGTLTVSTKSDIRDYGKTTFQFYITENGIIPFGRQGTLLTFERACNPNITIPYPDFDPNNNMYGCTAWVIQKGNMDYWKCPEKLGWNKASSCKN